MSTFSSRWKLLPVLSLAVLMAGCSGNDDSSATPTPTPTPTSTLGGTAATGAPIIGGTVNVKCAGGAALADTTDNSGVWEVTISGQTLPCAVVVNGGNLPSGQAYHSIAMQFGTVNITPLTDVLVANLAGQSPGTWFNGLNSNALQQLSVNNVNAALTNLRAAFNLPALNDVDPLTTPFTATRGNTLDDILEAMSVAYSNYIDLLNAAMGTNFMAYGQQNQTQLANALAALNSAGGGGSGGTNGGGTTIPGGNTGTTGNYTLTLDVIASGIALPGVTIANVPKPSTNDEFCSEIRDSSSQTSLSGALGQSGTLTINSCSFNGSVGNISATVAITTPLSMTVPYTVVYTYR